MNYEMAISDSSDTTCVLKGSCDPLLCKTKVIWGSAQAVATDRYKRLPEIYPDYHIHDISVLMLIGPPIRR